VEAIVSHDPPVPESRHIVESIWRAAVQAVDSTRLVKQAIRVEDDQLVIAGQSIPIAKLRHIEVVGAGKAGAGMALGTEELLAQLGKKVSGWVNVPADCVQPLKSIHLHPARPAGINEPTEAGVAGSEEILRRVASLGEGDLCLVLISGGGSALLPAPIEGVSLSDKALTIRRMSLAGAGIDELNCVRRQLSRVKGGGLARACRAQWMITLVISDVIGDPLEVIASGPTIDFPPEPQRALELLERFAPGLEGIPKPVVQSLRQQISNIQSAPPAARVSGNRHTASEKKTLQHVSIIGNNQTAVDAAELDARDRGLDVRVVGVGLAGEAQTVGRELADECLRLQPTLTRPLCLIGGGEPVVKVEKRSGPQKGGRNQELALSALCRLIDQNAAGITILSGGTDGEDGPTDAAGAIADDAVAQAAAKFPLDPRMYLHDHNSYPFFQQTGGLLITGPTHTNVMDVRVALVHPPG
jgi:glycerate 2-kinase